jgi:hypothetical protein
MPHYVSKQSISFFNGVVFHVEEFFRGVDVEESIEESYFLLLDNFCVIV